MGRINGSVTQKSDAYEYWIDWNESNVSIANNSSIVSATVYVKCNSHTSYENNKTSTLSINGQTFSNTLNINLAPGTTVALVSGSTTVTHNNDGSKTINISSSSALPNGSGWGPKSGSASANVSLTTIQRYLSINNFSLKSKTVNSLTFSWSSSHPRDFTAYSLNGGNWTPAGDTVASDNKSGNFTIYNLSPNTTYSIKIRLKRTDNQLWTETNAISITTYDIARLIATPNIDIGNNHTINWNNPSGSTTSLKLCKTDGTQVINYGNVTGTSKSITPTASAIYALVPDSKNITLRYIITTTANNISYTNYKDCVFTVINSDPTFSDFTYEDTNCKTTLLTGNSQILIKGYSNVKGTISTENKAIAKNSSTMKSYRMSIGNQSKKEDYSSNTDVNLTIKAIDSNVIDMYATDSRVNSTKISKNATIKNYSNIKIVSMQAIRENNIGAKVTLKFEGQFWNDNFGSVTNTIKSCVYKYKNTTSSEYIDGGTTLTYTISGNKITGNVVIKGDLGAEGFNVSNSYNIQLILADELSSATYTITLGSGNPAIAVYKNNIAIGQKYNADDNSKLQINGDINLSNAGNRININSHKGILRHWNNDTQISANNGVIYLRPKGDENTTNQITIENNGIVKAPRFSGQLTSTTGGSWWSARDNSTVRNNSFGQSAGNSFNVVATQKTTNGSWSIGNLSGEESLSFSYVTDTNYNNKNNNYARVSLPNTAGTIQLQPTTLYNNTSGTTGTITLSQTAANFAYLDISFLSNRGYTSTCRVMNPNGKNTFHSCIDIFTASSVMQFVFIMLTISGTSVTLKNNAYVNLNHGSGSHVGGISNTIKVIKILGYK